MGDYVFQPRVADSRYNEISSYDVIRVADGRLLGSVHQEPLGRNNVWWTKVDGYWVLDRTFGSRKKAACSLDPQLPNYVPPVLHSDRVWDFAQGLVVQRIGTLLDGIAADRWLPGNYAAGGADRKEFLRILAQLREDLVNYLTKEDS